MYHFIFSRTSDVGNQITCIIPKKAKQKVTKTKKEQSKYTRHLTDYLLMKEKQPWNFPSPLMVS